MLFRSMAQDERRRHRRRLWLALVVFAMSMSAYGGMTYWLWTRFETRWQRLRVGMTTEQVRALLGEPTTAFQEPVADDSWLNSFARGLLGTTEHWQYLRPDRNGEREHLIYFRDGRLAFLQSN